MALEAPAYLKESWFRKQIAPRSTGVAHGVCAPEETASVLGADVTKCRGSVNGPRLSGVGLRSMSGPRRSHTARRRVSCAGDVYITFSIQPLDKTLRGSYSHGPHKLRSLYWAHNQMQFYAALRGSVPEKARGFQWYDARHT